MTATEPRPAGPAPERARNRRRWPLLGLVVALVAGAVTVLGAGIGRDPTQLPPRFLGEPAPALSGRTLDGGTFTLAEHRGTVVLVNVWASWCVPCRREHPLLAEVARELSSRGLLVVGVNTQDAPAAAAAFLAAMGGAAYPSLDDSAGRIAVQWGTSGVPETFLVDQRGTVRAKVTGEVTAQWISQQLLPLLGG
ncbi:MAG: redoxin domain-containing protein [Actinobacteria bacterium]|nr:redoxin domain-containing protein [Actinomycetota bacterium]MBI3686553.1 redoxin domain-containing protein [Actinomycetota bacterium]